MNKNLIKILGIDPGYDRLGIAIIEKGSGQKDSVIYSDCFSTSSKKAIYVRLKEIGDEIEKILEKYKPDFVAIETLFVTKNQKTAMRVSEARGIVIYQSMKKNIPIYEYSPMEIKLGVTGDGKSDKKMIVKMLSFLVDLPNKKTHDDEYDAIAVALTHSSRIRHNFSKNNYPQL